MSIRDTPPDQPPGLTGSSGNSSSQLSLVGSFKIIIKRDSSQLTNLKKGNNWKTSCKSTLATTRSKGTGHVLKLEHDPLTQEDMNLFNEKKKFTHLVFSTTLQKDRGKTFVREYEEDFDAQEVCKKSHDFYETSVGARVSA